MAEYIERAAALSAQNKSMNLAECRKRLERLPAADVVPVLYCKDCRYCHYDRVGNIGCFHYRNYQTPGAEIKPYDYCSYAEQRTGYEEDRRYYERHNSSTKVDKDGDEE